MSPIARVTGMRDVLPEAAAVFEHVEDRHRAVAGAFGYRPLLLPVVEQAELIARGIGAGTDVVEKEMFAWTDKDGEQVALRPEGTVGAVRALLSANTEHEPHPIRVRYAGPMFRRDRPQRNRYRQFTQVGIECIGERAAALDAEVIEVGMRLFEALGVEGVSLQVNSLGDVDDRRRYREELTAYYRGHLAELCDDCRRRLEVNPLRLLDCKRDAHLVDGAPRITESLAPDSLAYFEAVLAALDGAGVAYTRNPRLVRGLDYYAHTAFEYQHVSLQGAQNALGGGGRYDGLAEVLDLPPTPGVGYALGVDRIVNVLDDLGAAPRVASTDVLVAALNEDEAGAAAAHARTLRRAGVRCVLDAGRRRLDRKLRQADRLGARVAVVVGPDEVAAGAATVRDLRSRDQERIPEAALADRVRALLATETHP